MITQLPSATPASPLTALRGLKLEAKIFIGFVLMLGLLCAFGLFTVANLDRVRGEAGAVARRDMPLLGAADDLRRAAAALLAADARYSLTFDPADGDDATAKIAALGQKIAAARAGADPSQGLSGLDPLAEKFEAFAGKPADDGTRDGGDFAAFAAAVDEMRDQRSTLQETEETFDGYLHKAAAEQQDNLRAHRDDPAKVTERLALIDAILTRTSQAARETARGISRREAAPIESAAQGFEAASADMEKLLALTPPSREWNAAQGVGLARKDLLSNAQSQATVYRASLANFLNAWKAMEEAKARCDRSVRDVEELAAALADGASRGATVRVGEALRSVDLVRNLTFGALPILLVAGFACAAVVTRLIGKSIERIVLDIARALAGKTGETLQTADRFHRAGEEMAAQASRQAVAVEQTGASLHEFSAASRATAARAREARSLAADARAAAESGGSGIEELGSAVVSVHGSAERLRASMGDLRAFSQDIAEVLREIRGLSMQTRILALNAAVEAARAGSHGAGFAVVAAEVGSLAARSAEASRRSGERIDLALHRVEEGALIGEEVLERVALIRRTADRVGGELGSIVERVRRVDAVMGEIASAADEQDAGVGQIHHAVAAIDAITQANATAARETAASAGLLRAQAAEVRRSVVDLVGMVGKGARAGLPLPAGPGRKARAVAA